MTYIMYNVKEVFLAGRIASMRVTREQAAANREKIVEVASRLFRKHGFDGIGVADIMKAAGLTHGGFYGHFESKDDLAASGATCNLSWCAFRRWNQSQVVYERHYNYEQKGGPLTLNDFRFTAAEPARFRLPS